METKRLVNPGAEELLGVECKVLDRGSVTLTDYMGTDESIVAAARVSYDKGVGDVAGNKRLIEFLMKHRHTSPFEHCILTFDIKAPIFVFRELVRHRTARLNEISGRYAELPEEYYVPELDRVQAQSTSNKQGSGEILAPAFQDEFVESVKETSATCFKDYHRALNMGVARELARITLPLNTYSKLRWQCDLHNLFHFLKLRMAPAAQWEIRQVANAIAGVVRDAFPMAWAAFDEHVLNAVTLSKTERAKVYDILSGFSSINGSKEDLALLSKIG